MEARSAPLSVTALRVTARQPEAQGRLQVTMFLIIGLVEGMYFINLALGFFFIYVIAK